MDEQKITEKLEQGRNFILKWWEKTNENLDKLSKQWQFIVISFLGFLSYIIVEVTDMNLLALLWFILIIVWRFSYFIKNKL